MAYTKVFSTTFGVTVAVVYAASGSADELQVINTMEDLTVPYYGSVYELPSGEVKAMDLYRAIFPHSENGDGYNINIYKQSNGLKQLITEESIILSPNIGVSIDKNSQQAQLSL